MSWAGVRDVGVKGGVGDDKRLLAEAVLANGRENVARSEAVVKDTRVRTEGDAGRVLVAFADEPRDPGAWGRDRGDLEWRTDFLGGAPG